MKLSRTILTLACAAILLAGCASADSGPEAPEGAAPDAAKATTAPAATASPSASNPVPPPTVKPSPLPTTVAQVDKLFGLKPSPTYTERGTVAKKIGEPGVKGQHNGVLLMVFRVNGIEHDVVCQDGTTQSENGRFVAIDMEFQTTKAMADVGWTEFTPYDWEYLLADGTMTNSPVFTEGAKQCLAAKETLPANIGSSRKASGKIVLDVADEPGFVIFGRDGLDNHGWEYKLSR